jgi:CDP-diacylglycerol--serine O-phosphatidyltransferase
MTPLYLHLMEVPATRGFAAFALVYVLVIALLMVSRIPHYSGKDAGRVPREWLAPVLFGVLVTLLLLATYTAPTLIALSVLYLAMIPWSVMRYRALERAEAEAGPSHSLEI